MHKDKLEAQEYHLVKRLISVRESREKIIRSGNTITEKIEKEHTGKNTLHQNTSSPNDQSYHDLLFLTTVGQETRWSNSRALKSTQGPGSQKVAVTISGTWPAVAIIHVVPQRADG